MVFFYLKIYLHIIKSYSQDLNQKYLNFVYFSIVNVLFNSNPSKVKNNLQFFALQSNNLNIYLNRLQ